MSIFTITYSVFEWIFIQIYNLLKGIVNFYFKVFEYAVKIIAPIALYSALDYYFFLSPKVVVLTKNLVEKVSEYVNR